MRIKAAIIKSMINLKRVLMTGLLAMSSLLNSEPFSFGEILNLKMVTKSPLFITAQDGAQLAYYQFADTSCQDIIILYAGAGMYGNQVYQWVASELYNKYQVGCYIFDLRGHGHSAGARGDAPSAEAVWQDVIDAISLIKKSHDQAKIHLTGHSSGAGLIVNVLARYANLDIESAILLAPYLGPNSRAIQTQTDVSQSFIKKVRSWVYLIGGLISAKLVAHVRAVFFNYPEYILKNDPLIVDSYTYAMSCATTPYEIKQLFAGINKPLAIYIGANDEQFIPEQVVAYQNGTQAQVDACIIPNTGHLSILLQAPKLIAKFIKKDI